MIIIFVLSHVKIFILIQIQDILLFFLIEPLLITTWLKNRSLFVVFPWRVSLVVTVGMAIDWEVSKDLLGEYVASSLISDYLVVARYDGTNTVLQSYWIENGKERKEYIFTDNTKVLAMIADKGDGIYALVKKPAATSSTDGTSTQTYGITLFGLSESTGELSDISSRWLNSDAIKNSETKESFAVHPPTQILLHYPPRSDSTSFPAVFLIAQLNSETNLGLITYEFTGANDYSYNPFAIKGSSASCFHPVSDGLTVTSSCLSCSSEKFLRGFTCNTNCDGLYISEEKRCGRCHFSCSSCTGPKRSQCSSCRDTSTFNTLMGQCFCAEGSAFTNGKCVGSQDANIFQVSARRETVPGYVFDLKHDYKASFVGLNSASNSESVRQLIKAKLPLPATITSLPDDFTISFWFHDVSGIDGRVILNAFNVISIRYSPPGYSNTIEFNVLSDTVIHRLTTVSDSWKFISLSIQNTPLGYTMTMFVYSSTGSLTDSYTKKGYTQLDFNSFDKEFLLGPGSTTVTGAFRDLLFIPRFYNKEDMEIARTLKYHDALQIKKDIISYWRLDYHDASGFTEEFDQNLHSDINYDSGVNAAGSLIPNKLITARASESKWGIIGTVFDMFGYSKFPAFSFDTLNFGANELEPKINLNTFSVLAGIIHEGDFISYHFNGCSGLSLGKAKVTLTAKDKVTIEKDVQFMYEKSVRGKFIDTCYCNEGKDKCLHLGRTYFPLLPTQIQPAHGKTNQDSTTPIQFALTGGDQSYGDKLTLINMGKDVLTTTKETVIVDEKDSGYSSYSAIRRTNGEYDKITTPTLDRGVYTIGWRPSYMSYLVDERNVIYKNLYSTWTLQGPPQVRYPPLEGVPGIFKNTVVHKGEFYYIDLVGDGQADGDQILFCNTGCNYPYRNSRPFQRENGRYPPIWIGEKNNSFGIFLIAESNRLAEKLFICWRPAARAATINPEDDQWTSLYGLQDPTKRAYIIINEVDKGKPEIEQLSLYLGNPTEDQVHYPVTTPVLFQGETIWFRFADKGSCPDFASNGRVEISRVVYDDYYKTSYTLEPVWEQECEGSLGSTNCATSKIKIDTKTCQYTLQEIPHAIMKPGHDYMLVIYSGTFATAADWLGNSDSGSQQFKFLFKYQESIFFDAEADKYVASDTSITIRGTNFGNLYIPGSSFVESRKLFGVAVEVIPDKKECGGIEIKAGYIPEHLEQDPTDIILQDLDLSKCKSSGVLTLNIKLMKIADDFADYPLWSHTSNYQPIKLGKVGCDSTCKTCSGPTSFDCTSCDIESSFPYLYKSRCLSKCENDMPYSSIVFGASGYDIAYYECTDTCKDGTYLNEKLGLCFECNSQCGTCSSGGPDSCITCGGTYVNVDNDLNYMNTYKELYSYGGMCFIECPQIYLVEGDPSTNVIKTREYEHLCLDDDTAMEKVRGIKVTIQDTIFPEKINIKRPIKLRALLTDLRDFDENTAALNAKYIWSTHPSETVNEELKSSDKRIFQNYTEQNLQRAITSLNMNAFNYKTDNDQMRIIVRAWANGFFDYDVIELYGNRPPELDDSNVKVRYSDKKLGTKDLTSKDNLKTNIELDVHISRLQDADDIYPKLNVKVILVPRSLVLPTDLTGVTVPESALTLLAQLPEQYMVIHSSEAVDPEDGVAHIQNIYIPALINGKQAISKSEGVYSSKVSCDLFVYAQDRFLGVSKSKFIFTFQETYDPNKGETTLQELTDYIKDKDDNRKLTWNDALRVAHTLRAINPEHTVYYMAYNHCTRDDQCNNGGKCVTSGGWSKCVCSGEYTGITCSWNKEHMVIEEELIGMVVKFLDNTVLVPLNNRKDYEVESTDNIDLVANILIGILSNPEPIRAEYFSTIVGVAQYMTQINYITGGRLEDFEKSNVFKALDAVIKYTHYHIRQDIYEFYLLGELLETLGDQQVAEYNEMRKGLSSEVLKVRNALYRFTEAVSLVQYPLANPYSVEYDSFEVFLSAELEESMFVKLGDSLAIQLRSGDDFIKIPPSILDTMRKEISINEEFKIRIIKWKENPYLFSDYHSEVCTPLFNFAIMNSNSTLLDMDLTEPIVFLTPMSKSMKNLPSEAIRCMYFNDKKEIQSKIKNATKINVNQLDLTDEEKMALYPEWNPEFYHSKNLIIEEENYPTTSVEYPEFENVRGLSSYGNILNPTDYTGQITCALYSGKEVAAITERKRSHNRGYPTIDFFYDYDPMDSVYFNIGMYTCVVIGALMIFSLIGAKVLDTLLLPRHQQIIKGNRASFDRDLSVDIHAKDNPLFSVDSGGSDGSDKREDKVKVDVDVTTGSHNSGHKKRGKRKLNRKRTGREKSTMNDTSKATQSKDTTPDDNGLVSINTNVMGSTSQTKVELKSSDNTINTTHGNSTNVQTGTQDVNTDNAWSSSDPQTTNPGIKDIFPDPKKGKRLTQPVENIFSSEHIKRIEIETFKFGNIYISSNLLLNLLFRTNNIFTRTVRCFSMYAYIYIMFFWCAVLTSIVAGSLRNPENGKPMSFIASQHIWIIFIAPILTSILHYLVAGVYKVDEGRIREGKTMQRYLLSM